MNTVDFSGKDIGGIIFQYPDTEGSIHNFGEIISQARYTLDFESKHTVQYPDTEGSIHNFGEIISQARYTLDFESKHTGITGSFIAYFCNCALENVMEL